VYVAVDLDALEPPHAISFMPEPGGLTLADAEEVLGRVAVRGTVVGAGFSGLVPDERNAGAITRLAAALGL
jgi:arginase family enzyme